MADQAQDRHLPATERKIKKAREDGQVARSRDLGHFAALAVGLVLLASGAPWLMDWSQQLLMQGLRFDAASLVHTASMGERLASLGMAAMAIVLSLGAAIVVAALVAGVLSGGWNFSWKPLAPRWEKLDPSDSCAVIPIILEIDAYPTSDRLIANTLVCAVSNHAHSPPYVALAEKVFPAKSNQVRIQD